MNRSDSSFAGVIGAAARDITPPVGIYNRSWGAATSDTATGIHRPLSVTALTLQTQAREPAHVLVGLDLGWWRTAADELYVRSAVIEACGLGPDRLLMNLCHSHAGPSMCREDIDMPGGKLIQPYMEYVIAQSIAAVNAALAQAQPAVMGWTYGKCDLAQNRDKPDPGRNRFVCGWNPDAKADDTMLVGRVTALSGEVLATIVNYACHPVTLAWDNTLISPDFIGAMRETVQRDTGGAPCLFLQGASGELAPREEYLGDTAIADSNGRILGYAALSALAALLPPATVLDFGGTVESGAPLAVWHRAPANPPTNLSSRRLDIALPLKPAVPVAEIERQMRETTDRVLAERLRRKLHVQLNVGEDDHLTVPMWVWRIGDMRLVGQENEAYSTLQTTVRAACPGRAVAVMNLVNGGRAYLPPKETYATDIYQVWQTPFDAGSLELLIGAAIGELAE